MGQLERLGAVLNMEEELGAGDFAGSESPHFCEETETERLGSSPRGAVTTEPTQETHTRGKGLPSKNS